MREYLKSGDALEGKEDEVGGVGLEVKCRVRRQLVHAPEAFEVVVVVQSEHSLRAVQELLKGMDPRELLRRIGLMNACLVQKEGGILAGKTMTKHKEEGDENS